MPDAQGGGRQEAWRWRARSGGSVPTIYVIEPAVEEGEGRPAEPGSSANTAAPSTPRPPEPRRRKRKRRPDPAPVARVPFGFARSLEVPDG